MLARILSTTLIGIEGFPVEVEIDISRGLPSYSTVGLPDNAVKESKDRVKAAIKNSGYTFPTKNITVNLAPADIKKEGTTFDLPVAVGILAATGVVTLDGSGGESVGTSQEGPGGEGDGGSGKGTPDINLDGYLIVGELSLDGRVKPLRGALPIGVLAKELGGKTLILPADNAREAALVGGIDVKGVSTLADVVELLNGNLTVESTTVDTEDFFKGGAGTTLDLSEVRGQEYVKRGLEVAAAGGHNVLMIGPPGSGKTMLAKRFATILPDLSLDEAVETTKVHSVAGLLRDKDFLVTTRPFRGPHHTVSDAGLIGGGAHPRPGEVSLAHNGLLFLDELPEFKKNLLEMLRQPVEDGLVTISRAAVALTYPSDFMLVGAMNPCPCGYLGDTAHECMCSDLQIERYRRKLSGPLLDRIDIHLDVPAVPFKELTDDRGGERSEVVKARVDRARRIQSERFKESSGSGGVVEGKKKFSNSAMSESDIKRYCRVDSDGRELLEGAISTLGLSARAYTRILKVARTIADLEGTVDIRTDHIGEAIQYRTLDRGA